MLTLWLLSVALSVSYAAVNMQERYSWNALDWNYPDRDSKQQALLSGSLIPENALPVGIERWRNKLFVSVPRWRPGIPATLNYIPLDGPYDPSPKLTPYPSWQGNQLANCETGLNTVYRIKADKCDRLWVLDTGTYGYDNTTTNPCPYALNVYDLKTDQRIRRYVLRAEDIVMSSFIANIAIDVGNSCEDTFAYMSDELGYGLITYSWEANKSWRFTHSYFMPDPLRGDFNIAGMNFQWGAEGIFGITLSPIGQNGFRMLFFSPLASHTEFAVSTEILRDENRVSESYHDFKVVGARGSDSHLTSKVMSANGVQLYNLIDQNAIGCWNSALPYKPQNLAVVEKDDVGLIFPSDVKIDEDQNVWVISDRMSIFLEAQLDYSDINFRIYTSPLSTLIDRTVCAPTKPPQGYLNNLENAQKLTTVVPSTPFVYYNTRIPSNSNHMYGTTTSSKAPNSLSSPYTENVIPHVSSYVTHHKQPAMSYFVSPSTKANDLGTTTYYGTVPREEFPSRHHWHVKEVNEDNYE